MTDVPDLSSSGAAAAPPAGGHSRPALGRRAVAIGLTTAAMGAAFWLGGRVVALMPWSDAAAADLAGGLPAGYAVLIAVAGVVALGADLVLRPLAGAAAWLGRRLPRLDSARRQTILAWALVAAIFSVLWLLLGLDVEGARVLLSVVIVFAGLMHGGLIFFACLGTGYSLWRGPAGLGFVGFCQGFFVPG